MQLASYRKCTYAVESVGNSKQTSF